MPIYLLVERKRGEEGKKEELKAGERSKFCQFVDNCYIMMFSLGSCSIFNAINNLKFS